MVSLPIASKKEWRIGGIVAALALVFHAATVSGYHSWGDDFAQYILHARNLATGTPYLETGYLVNPVDPVQLDIGPKMYPPLMPALLSPVYRIFGPSLRAMKYQQVVLLVLASLLSTLYFHLRSPDLVKAPLFLAVLAFHPFLWDAKEYIGSDLLFLALCYTALLLADRITTDPYPSRGLVAALGICLYLCYATRTVGVVLVPVVLCLAVLKRHRYASLLAAIGVGCALMLGQSLVLSSDKTYLQLLIDQAALRTTLRNAIDYGKDFSAVWSNGFNPRIAQIIYLLSIPVAAWGAFRMLQKRIAAVDVFLLGYTATILIWPSFQGARFLLPLLPVYLFYLLAGVRHLPRLGRHGVSIAAAALLLTYSVNYLARDYQSPEEGIGQPAFADLTAVIQETTQPGDRFLFRKPRALALLTKRSAAVYNSTRDDARSWALIRQLDIRYVVAANLPDDEDFASDQDVLSPFLEAYPEVFQQIYSNSRFDLFKVGPLPPGVP